jgi:hypothetical protein
MTCSPVDRTQDHMHVYDGPFGSFSSICRRCGAERGSWPVAYRQCPGVAKMNDDAKLLKAKNDLLQQASALIEEFYTAPSTSSAFDWELSIARTAGQFNVRVRAGGPG